MRLIVVNNVYPPRIIGGYELGCRNVVAGLVDRGHEVMVLTSPSHVREDGSADAGTGGAQMVRTLALHTLGPPLTRSAVLKQTQHFEAMVSSHSNTATLLESIRNFRPDCVYVFNPLGIGGLALLDSMNMIGMPWVLHLMDNVPVQLQENIPLPVLSLFNAHHGKIYSGGHVISMSASLVREIEQQAKIRFDDRPVIIPGWVNAAGPVRDRRYAPSGHVRFVTAGYVSKHKGTGIIIQAAALLKAAGIRNFEIEVFGDGHIGPFVSAAKHLNVLEHISFRGQRRQDELAAAYLDADAFLFPTWPREPFGFAPLEAAAAGCIPIVTRQAGVCEQLTDQVDCFMIEQTVADLAAVMQRFCRGEIDVQTIGRNAQTVTRGRLHFETCLMQIEEELHKAWQNRGKGRAPGWREMNASLLKHRLALKMFLQAVTARFGNDQGRPGAEMPAPAGSA